MIAEVIPTGRINTRKEPIMSARLSFVLAGLVLLFGLALHADGGEIYRITSTDGTKQTIYQVSFGGGKSSGKLTAFCPTKKDFVYLSWNDDQKRPAPAAVIWDHRTGETINLYKFPDSPNLLPAIPGVNAMKVCPFTGDTKFKVMRVGFYD
jgi:hypothetical protein